MMTMMMILTREVHRMVLLKNKVKIKLMMILRILASLVLKTLEIVKSKLAVSFTNANPTRKFCLIMRYCVVFQDWRVC